MAVDAAPALQDRSAIPASNACCTGLAGEQGLNGSVRCVAALAQERRARLEHILGRGSVRVVAVAAVFVDWFMAVDKRTAFFHVAGVAGLDHAVALHEFGAGGAMHVVAVRARHLAFDQRVVRGLVDLGSLFFVASEANLGLGALVAYLVAAVVNGMAGSAGYVARIVGATAPVRALGILVVAGQACSVALGHWCGRRLAEGAIGLDFAGSLFVTFAGAMAGNAGGGATIGRGAVLGFADGQHHFIVPVAVVAFLFGRQCRPSNAAKKGKQGCRGE